MPRSARVRVTSMQKGQVERPTTTILRAMGWSEGVRFRAQARQRSRQQQGRVGCSGAFTGKHKYAEHLLASADTLCPSILQRRQRSKLQAQQGPAHQDLIKGWR